MKHGPLICGPGRVRIGKMGVHNCGFCNGTGIDDSDPLGRCGFCHGTGEVEDRDARLYDDEDESEAER